MEHAQLDDFALFIRIAELGSLRQASIALEVPMATLSRRLQKLEEKLGCKLLLRGSGRFALTDAGHTYFDQLRPLVTEMNRTLESIDTRHNEPAGILKIALPVNLARSWLAPFFSTFLRKHPHIDLRLTLSNRVLPLGEFNFDVAIRVGKQTQQSLVLRKLCDTYLVACAAPEYLAKFGTPTSPEELRYHAMIVASPLRTWRLTHRKTGRNEVFSVDGRFDVDEIELASLMIEEGHDIGLVPHSIISNRLRAGRLVALLPDWETEQRDIFAVWPETDFMPKRQRVFIDELVAFATQNPADR